MANRKNVIERFIVAEGNQALTNTANAGSNLYNMTTKAYRLADKQIGIVYMDNEKIGLKDKIVAAPTTLADLESLKIQLVQGTYQSAIPLTNQTQFGTKGTDVRVMRSAVIDLSKPIYFAGTGVLSRNERSSAQWITGFTATSNKKYVLRISSTSPHMTKLFSQEAMNNHGVIYTSPDYTGVTSPIDSLYKNIGLRALQDSGIYYNAGAGYQGNKNYAVFGIGLTGAGTSVTINGTAYATPTVGTVISGVTTSLTVAVNVTAAGVNRATVFTPDVAFREMLQAAVTAGKILSTDRFIVMEASTAGASATANACKGLLITGLTLPDGEVQDESFEDKMTTVYVTSDTNNGASASISTASSLQKSEGKAKVLKALFEEDAIHDQGNLPRWGSQLTTIPHYVPITDGKWYTMYMFEGELRETEYNAGSYTTGEVIITRTYLLVESAAPGIATGGITQVTTQAGLTTFLKPILELAPNKKGFTTATF